MQAPSTTMHSVRTCPEVSGRGFARRPLQAGHQIWRAKPGLGALFPIGAWSINHWQSTFRKEFKKKKMETKRDCVQSWGNPLPEAASFPRQPGYKEDSKYHIIYGSTWHYWIKTPILQLRKKHPTGQENLNKGIGKPQVAVISVPGSI